MNDTTRLVSQAQAGDVHAFALLYEQVYKDLYRFALYTLRHAQDAEDAVSETVTEAFSRIGQLRESGAFRAWIFRILSARCARKIRRYASPEYELDEAISSTAPDLDGQLDVRRAFASLPKEDRLILSMNLFAGYSSQETGEILQMNPNTVRSRQSRALKKLGELLSPVPDK